MKKLPKTGKGKPGIKKNLSLLPAQKPLNLIPTEIDPTTDEALKRQAAMLDLAHDAVLVRDVKGRIQFWNTGAEVMYGWSKEQAVGKLKQELLKPEPPRPWKQIQAELLRNGHWEGELVHVRHDGGRRVVQSRWALRKDGPAPVVLEINSDVTDQRKSEENLRNLSSRLLRLQDEERRRIARELHDSTGQKLALVKMGLESLAKQPNPVPASGISVSECLISLDEAISEIRTLAQLLHPPLLDEAGLAAAIRWLADGFSRRSSISVNVQLPQNMRRLPQDVEIALFRIIQEALNNVHRHSGSSGAQIEIREHSHQVSLRISDNGKGMPDTSSGVSLEFGVGIQGMKERIVQLGGTLEVASSRKGTTITATIPADPHSRKSRTSAGCR